MKKPINDVEDLDVYQRGMDLAEAVYRLIPLLPVEERFALGVQLRKAAVSVPSNIAEGYGRRGTGDYRRFLGFASSSNREINTQLRLAVRVKLLDAESVAEALELSRRVAQMLTKLIKSLPEEE